MTRCPNCGTEINTGGSLVGSLLSGGSGDSNWIQKKIDQGVDRWYAKMKAYVDGRFKKVEANQKKILELLEKDRCKCKPDH